MMTFIVLAVYISGVLMAFYQLQKWHEKEPKNMEEFQALFMLSMLSWLIYPVYGLAWLYNKCEEE